MKRLKIQLVLLLSLSGIAFYLVASGGRHSKGLQNKKQCSNTNYGKGVVCVGGAGNGGDNTHLAPKNLTFSPTPGHPVISTPLTLSHIKRPNVPTTNKKK